MDGELEETTGASYIELHGPAPTIRLIRCPGVMRCGRKDDLIVRVRAAQVYRETEVVRVGEVSGTIWMGGRGGLRVCMS